MNVDASAEEERSDEVLAKVTGVVERRLAPHLRVGGEVGRVIGSRTESRSVSTSALSLAKAEMSSLSTASHSFVVAAATT